MVRWTYERGLLAVLLVMCSVPLSLGLSVGIGDLQAVAQSNTISSIVVQGNQRVEDSTIISYMTVSPGDPFDPALHEAMAQTPDASVPPNTITEVFERGYQLRSRLLRPARVVVSKLPDAGSDAEGGDPQ